MDDMAMDSLEDIRVCRGVMGGFVDVEDDAKKASIVCSLEVLVGSAVVSG